MFLRVGNMMKLLTFDKKKYDELVDNIEKSNGYVCYINSKLNNGLSNNEYCKYLDEKQEVYTSYIVPSKREKDKIYERMVVSASSLVEKKNSEQVPKETIEGLYRKYGISDDYIINMLDDFSQDDFSVKVYQAVPMEKEIYDLILHIDDSIESIKVAKHPLLFPRLETTVSFAHQRKIPCGESQGWGPYSQCPNISRFLTSLGR